MDNKTNPRYPIYIPSKGRWENSYTADTFIKDGVPFFLVVEPQESDKYIDKFGADRVVVLPFSNLGSVIPTRNFIKEYSKSLGHKRHWQFDDNIRDFYRWYKGKRIKVSSGIAIRLIEDFTDRYENVAISGFNYTMFAITQLPPFHLNCRVYSATLFLNSLPHKWRGKYNEDADICLQVLADGWCTILVNAFLVGKVQTMKIKGGNTSEIYHGDGRLKMARSLERVWPHVVSTKRRFKRPQHVIRDAWQKFDTQLKLKEGLTLDDFKGNNEYGMKLVVKGNIRSDRIKKLVSDFETAKNEEDKQDG